MGSADGSVKSIRLRKLGKHIQSPLRCICEWAEAARNVSQNDTILFF